MVDHLLAQLGRVSGSSSNFSELSLKSHALQLVDAACLVVLLVGVTCDSKRVKKTMRRVPKERGCQSAGQC